MAPKGGNAKKESGRTKKAENEAKKQEAAAANKVCNKSHRAGFVCAHGCVSCLRRVARLRSGRMAQSRTRRPRTRKRSERPTLHERRRTHGYLQRRRLLLPRSRPHLKLVRRRLRPRLRLSLLVPVPSLRVEVSDQV